MAAGCSQATRCCPRGGAAPAILVFEEVLPAVERGALEFDLTEVGTLADVDRTLGRELREVGHYRSLTAEECQCLAAAASTQGNSLAAEQRAVRAGASRKGLDEEDRAKIRVLAASELEARNRSAGAALELYYRLAEAEANLALVDLGIEELDDALANVASMRGQGMQITIDDSELARQRIDLMDQRVELERTLAVLNAELIRLVGLATGDLDARIWPDTDWKVVVEPVDVEAAVEEGLSLRPEIGLIAFLRGSLNEETLGVSRQVMGGASGLLGTQPKLSTMISLLGLRQIMGQTRANERELPLRRRQLADYERQRREEIAGEIRQAALTAEARQRQVALAKEESLSWGDRLRELEQKKEIGAASFADISAARLASWQAHSGEAGAVVAWKVALVKLKEAQGRLVDECLPFLCAK